MRSRRVISSSRCGRPAPALTIACSIGSGSPRLPVANTARCQTFASSGGSRRTIRRPRSPVTDRPQRSMRVATSPASRVGASNALPSSRPRNASATSVAVRTVGGGAGISSWRAPSRQIASTMPVSAERVSARASTSWSSASSEPGIVSIEPGEPHRIDERGRPAHRVRTVGVACRSAPARALAQERNHRAACGELDGPDRDPTQPADTRTDAFAPGRRRPRPANRARRRPGSPARRRVRLPAAGPRRGASTRHGGAPAVASIADELVAAHRTGHCGPRPRRRPVRVPTRPAPRRRRARAALESTSSRSSRALRGTRAGRVVLCRRAAGRCAAPTRRRGAGAPTRGRR